MALILQVMQMITQYTLWETIRKMLFSNCKIRQKNLFQSFMDKSMKANLGKCHFICSTNDTLICSTNDTLNLFVENQIIHNIKCEKVLV